MHLRTWGRWASPIALAALAAGALIGCGDAGTDPLAPLPARLRMTQQPGVLSTMRPVDLKASSSSTLWVADGMLGVVLKLDLAAERYEMFGYRDHEPKELSEPARIAVDPSLGVIVYDQGTHQVDEYTSGGIHLRGFAPGFIPSFMEVSQRPLGLLFAVASPDVDTIPRLLIIRSDMLGERRDTLLGPLRGPEALRNAIPRSGEVTMARSSGGLWVWSRSVPDTVFEVTGKEGSRRLVLREADQDVDGLLSDAQQEILWIAKTQEAGYQCAGYDLREEDLRDPGVSYIGARTTGANFVPQDAVNGSVVGWSRQSSGEVLAASYDMRVDLLRRRHNQRD